MKKPSFQPEEEIKLHNYGPEYPMRYLHISRREDHVTVYYHPEEGRWFATHDNDDQQVILTKTGQVRLCDIREKKDAILFCFPCFEDKNEIMILKDESGLFAVLTMSPNGYYYGSDREGFGYKTVHLYFDTWTRPLEGSVHYLTTKNIEGKWDVVWICCPQYFDKNHKILGINLGITRKWLIKGRRTEKKALDDLALLGGPSFNDTRRYILYDLTSNYSQDLVEEFCRIDGNIVTVTGFFSNESSKSSQRVSVCMWPTSLLRSAYKVKDNYALAAKIVHQFASDNYFEPVKGFHEKLKEFTAGHGIRFRINIEEEN